MSNVTPGGDLTTHSLRDTFGNDGNGFDLRELHELQSRAVDGSRGCEVDDSVDVGVFGDCLVHRLVDGQKSFAGAPVPE